MDTKKKLAEMEAQAKEEAAQQEEQEKREKEKLQAALKKQLEAPGPVVLPNWTPVTPEFKAAGAPARKIVDDEVDRSDWYLIAYSGENSGQLASGNERSEQSQSEP